MTGPVTTEQGAMTTAPVVDTRGMRCPWPALRLARAMRSAPCVTLIADDPQAEREVTALAAQQGWHLDRLDRADPAQHWHVRQH